MTINVNNIQKATSIFGKAKKPISENKMFFIKWNSFKTEWNWNKVEKTHLYNYILEIIQKMKLIAFQ